MKYVGLFITALAAFGFYFLLKYAGLFGLNSNIEDWRYEVDVNTGKKLYTIKAYHWYRFKIVRYESYFDVPEDKVDSIKAVEMAMGEKIKGHLN